MKMIHKPGPETGPLTGIQSIPHDDKQDFAGLGTPLVNLLLMERQNVPLQIRV
jgi:hypothetical protein